MAGPTSDNLWPTAANWGGTAPSSGDDAVFPSLGGIRSVDLTGSQQINSVQFNSGSPNTYLLYDGSLDISTSIDQAGSADGSFYCAVSFASAVTFSGVGSGNVYLQGGLSGSPFISMVGGNYWWSGASGFSPAGLNITGGYLHLIGTTIVNCTATDACGNVGSCSFTVTVTQQILTGSILLGLPDCYKQPTEPAIKSAALLAAHPGSCWRPFDYTGVNCAFGASFMGLPNTITCAQLTITMQPNCSDNPENDSISIGLGTNGTGGYTNAWSSYIGGGNASPGLTSDVWCGQTGCAQQFTLNLASMPAPGGNLLPLMNAQGKLDIYVQDDTFVDFARLNYCYCRVRPWWNGWDWNLVNADIAVGQSFASFSPLWSVGYPTNFSVSLAPGATHGIQIGLVPLNLGAIPNASLTVSAQTTLEPTPSAISITGDGSNTMSIALSAAGSNVTQVQLVFRLAGAIVFQETLPATLGSNLVSVLGGASLRAISVQDDLVISATDTQLAVSLDGPHDIKCPLCPPMVADEVDVTFVGSGPPNMPDNLLSSLTLSASGLTELQLTGAAAEVGGLFPQATGNATAIAAGDQLSYGNLGSSGQDGYTVSTSPTLQLALGMTVAQNLNGTTESNGVVSGTFTGMVSGDMVDVSHFSFTQSATGWDLNGDFSGLGSTAQHVQVLNQGTLVADLTFTGHPHVPVLPASYALQVTAQGTWSSFTWPAVQSLTINGTAYGADELRLLPVAPDLTLNAITALAVQASGIDALTLSSVIIAPEPAWVLQPPLITPASMTSQWSGPAGGILKSAPTLLGPWTPVSGQSGNSAVLPSPLTNGVPKQFFRVQAN